MAKRALLIISNPKQAAYRLRFGQLLEGLRARGVEMEVAVRPKGVLGRWQLAHTARGYEVVIVQRKLLEPWEARLLGGRSARQQTQEKERERARIWFDVDDAVMFRPGEASAFSRWRQGRRFRATAGILDLVVAGNEYLAEQFAAQGCKFRLLPTTVDLGHYQVKRHEVGAGEPVRLVWIGSRSTLPYVRQFLPYFEQAQRELGNLELVTIADATVESAVLKVRHIPWSEAGEAAGLVEGDIGIAPTPEDPWARGKCGFKIIQYMASSLPVIASPVGLNASIVREGVTGLLPRAGEEWPGAIARLAKDVELRRAMGAAGREVVREEYSIERAIDFWAGLFAEMESER